MPHCCKETWRRKETFPAGLYALYVWTTPASHVGRRSSPIIGRHRLWRHPNKKTKKQAETQPCRSHPLSKKREGKIFLDLKCYSPKQAYLVLERSEHHPYFWGFPSGSVGKESAFNALDVGDAGSIPGLGRSLEEGTATRSSILAWEIPWTEEPSGL